MCVCIRDAQSEIKKVGQDIVVGFFGRVLIRGGKVHESNVPQIQHKKKKCHVLLDLNE